jgi:hypothetical protein
MNKAFTKEPEQSGGNCPRCGSLGTAVGCETLDSFILPEARAELGNSAYFCGFARCEAAYFDDYERVVTVEQLRRAVWPKDLTAPICGCFCLTSEDVAADIREGGVTRIKGVVTKAGGPTADCKHLAADGRSCAAEVQRYYFKLRTPRAD